MIILRVFNSKQCPNKCIPVLAQSFYDEKPNRPRCHTGFDHMCMIQNIFLNTVSKNLLKVQPYFSTYLIKWSEAEFTELTVHIGNVGIGLNKLLRKMKSTVFLLLPNKLFHKCQIEIQIYNSFNLKFGVIQCWVICSQFLFCFRTFQRMSQVAWNWKSQFSLSQTYKSEKGIN